MEKTPGTLPELTPSFFEFVNKNATADIKVLRLRMHGKQTGFNTDFALTQIECRQKCIHKLRDFISQDKFLFPSVIAGEQASHQAIAIFHSSLTESGKNIIDMTAGLGIDSMTFASRELDVISFELDPLKADVLRHNAAIAGLRRLTVVNADSIVFIKENSGFHDYIFIDPARRSASYSRTYDLHDCVPDVLTNMEMILPKCGTLIIKASPMLDISKTIRDIPCAKSIRAVSVDGECKEVLIEAAAGESLRIVEGIDLDSAGNVNYRFSCGYEREVDNMRASTDSSTPIHYATQNDLLAGNYLYEPGAAIMKIAPWHGLSNRWPSLRKAAPSSHLFVSAVRIDDFPGRRLRIERIIGNKDRKTLKGLPANVVSRNYPVSSEELRKKLGVREGRDRFIYGTRIGNTPTLIEATRIS